MIRDVILAAVLVIEFAAVFFGVIIFCKELERKDGKQDGLEKKIDK